SAQAIETAHFTREREASLCISVSPEWTACANSARYTTDQIKNARYRTSVMAVVCREIRFGLAAKTAAANQTKNRARKAGLGGKLKAARNRPKNAKNEERKATKR